MGPRLMPRVFLEARRLYADVYISFKGSMGFVSAKALVCCFIAAHPGRWPSGVYINLCSVMWGRAISTASLAHVCFERVHVTCCHALGCRMNDLYSVTLLAPVQGVRWGAPCQPVRRESNSIKKGACLGKSRGREDNCGTFHTSCSRPTFLQAAMRYHASTCHPESCMTGVFRMLQ
jgi:hypothetical protein